MRYWALLVVLCLVVVCGCGSGDRGRPTAVNRQPSTIDDDDDDNDDASPGDDDASPASGDIWSSLQPSGMPIGKIMGDSTEMSNGADPQPDRTLEIDTLVQIGVPRVRASIDWSQVEPTKGEFTFTTSDAFMKHFTDAGLQFDGRLCYGIDWAEPDGTDDSLDPADFAGYAGAVAGHFCGTVNSYEIWNEENTARFWSPQPNPDKFGALMKAAYTAIHDACPQAQVVFGGLSCFDRYTFVDGFYYFLELVRQAHPDIGDYFDVMAIHPYTLLQTSSPEWTWTFGSDDVWGNMRDQIQAARARMTAMGAGDKPIWLTEFGWPSLIVGKDLQAAWLVRGALLSIAAGVEAMDWYTFYDGDGTNPLPTEDYFGLFTWPGGAGGAQPKPDFGALRTLLATLGSYRYAADFSAPLNLPVGVYAFAYQDEQTGALAFAGWDSRGGTTALDLPMPAGAAGFTVIDDQGNVTAKGAPGPFVSLELGNHAIYVTFAKSK